MSKAKDAKTVLELADAFDRVSESIRRTVAREARRDAWRAHGERLRRVQATQEDLQAGPERPGSKLH